MTDAVSRAFESFYDLKEEDFFRSKLPHHVTESIEQLTDAFLVASSTGREEIVQRVQGQFRFIFESYAYYAAQEAIRENNPALVKRGLIALTIQNTSRDWRDTLPILAFLYRSGRKLNMDASGLFHEVAQTACPAFRGFLEDFLNRDETSRTIESFHFKETGEEDTFAYVYVEPSYSRPSMMKLKLDRYLRRLKKSLR